MYREVLFFLVTILVYAMESDKTVRTICWECLSTILLLRNINTKVHSTGTTALVFCSPSPTKSTFSSSIFWGKCFYRQRILSPLTFCSNFENIIGARYRTFWYICPSLWSLETSFTSSILPHILSRINCFLNKPKQLGVLTFRWTPCVK